MADTTLTNGNFWSTVFNTTIAAINDTDSVLVKAASGTTDTIITAALLRAYLQKGITPSIGTDGYWYIGGVLIKDASGNPIQISAEGKTPTIAMKTIGGVKGLYLTYKGSSAEDTDWTLLVTATDLMFTFDELTDAQKQSFLTYFTDAIANCNTATTNANTATANCETATSKANAAISNVNNTLAQLVTQGANSVWVFMVRKHGNSDPAAYKWYGTQSNIKLISLHARMGWFKNKKDYTVCAKGRITCDVNGNDIAMDGTQGDLLMFFDTTMHHYENTVTDATDGDLDIIGVGLTPTILLGKESSKMPPCGFFPDRAVMVKLDSDTASCAHSIYNTAAKGTYNTPSTMFKEAYVTDGGGKASQYISSMGSIAYSQTKNADGIHGDGWYGLYYICYQIWLEMMFIEGGSVKHTLLDTGFGVGCTQVDVADSTTFYGDTIYGNSGVKTILSDGTVKGYDGLMSQPWKASATGSVIYAADAIDGGAHYGFIKLLEALRVSDAIVKNGWEAKIGVASNIFYFDDNNNLQLSSDGSINLSTGTGMTPNKKYYVARNVTGYAGLSDGVTTCVINAYMKMSFIDAACYSDGTSLVGGCAIYKFSMPLFRGVTWFNGTFTQLQGFHYMIHTDANGVKTNNAIYQPDYTALPSITNNNNSNCYGLETDTLAMEKGMLKTENIQFGDGWASKCNPAVSLFYYPNLGGDRRTYENAYVWKGACWCSGVNGVPEKGYKCVNASVVGCYCSNDSASVRTVAGSASAVLSDDGYCGGSALIGIEIGGQS